MRRPFTRVALMLACGLPAACQATRGFEPPPVPEGAHAALILVREADAASQLYASPIGIDASEWPELRLHGPASLEIGFLGCTLEHYGLPASALPIAEQGRALPNPIGTLISQVADGPLAWASIDGSAAQLGQLRIATPAPDVCPSYASEPLYLPGSLPGDVNILLPLLDGRAFVGTERSEYYLVEPGMATRLVELSTTTPNSNGFTPDGLDIWLFSVRGQVVRGSLAAGFAPGPGLSAGERHNGEVEVAGAQQAPLEMYAVSRSDIMERYADGAWQVIAEGTGTNRDRPGVAFIEPGHAIGIGVSFGQVTRYRAGTVSQERVIDASDSDTLDSIAWVPGVGEVVMSRNGAAYVSGNNGTWQLLARVQASTANTILPLPDGFLVGSLNGSVYAYDTRVGFCPLQGVAPNEVIRMARFGDQIVVVTDFEDLMGTDPVSVSFVRRLNPDPPCL